MEQPFSTSKVTVEYFDPHDVYKLLGPGLVPRLPLRNLHWQSHSGPLRSIDVLYVELLNAGAKANALPTLGYVAGSDGAGAGAGAGAQDDGFQTQPVGENKVASTNSFDAPSSSLTTTKERRHQIPGLRQTPYLKVLLVRCDDNETYKATTRAEIREWVKEHTPPSQSTRKVNTQENHDAFEWLIIHVVVPNTVAATQPRISGKSAEGSASDKSVPSSSSRWRTGSSTLLEKMRADFAVTGKNSVDRVAQIRIGINDVPYDILPRVVPATPTGYSETDKDAENAWNELLMKFRSLILSSFDMRVSQYEDDIREKDAQRRLPGWNFCTFFILKEGLARGFESVGLVEDALVGYDELGVGLDAVVQDQIESGEPERNGGALLSYTEDLRNLVERVLSESDVTASVDDEEPVDLQSQGSLARDDYDEIPISSMKKPYRDMIVANNVSVFDFRCYIFSRQIALLLRLGNASSSKEELLEKLREQQEAVTNASSRQAGKLKNGKEDGEDLSMLADVCQRTLQFIPAISHIMRKDITSALSSSNEKTGREHSNSSSSSHIIDNLVATFAFSVAQQVLAQTATDSLPIPPSSLELSQAQESQERKMSIPDPKTSAHPARSSSLHVRPTEKPLHSPGVFPGPGANRRASVSEGNVSAPRPFVKTGLGLLAAKRAGLYALTRSVLEECGKQRGWNNGWASVPDTTACDVDMEEINLDDESPLPPESKPAFQSPPDAAVSGIENRLLRAALSNKDDFYRLYETLTDKTLRHYLVAEYDRAVQSCLADLAVLKYYLADYAAAASYFHRTTPFFSEWRHLELSMLIMYAHCLQELRRKDEYVRVALKLLTKAAAAQKDRLSRKRSLGFGTKQTVEEPKMAGIEGLVGQLLDVVTALPNEVPVALAQIVTDVEFAGNPQYDESQDGFTLGLNFRSLLVDNLTIERGRMCLSAASAGPAKEIWLECTGSQVIKPGRNMVLMHSKTLVGGQYHVERLSLMSSKLHFYYDRDIDQAQASTADAFRLPLVKIFRPSGGLDCRLSAARDIQLDQNNRLDLKLSTGWNAIDHCEIRIRPGTGGLRLLTTDAQFVDCNNVEFALPPEAGLLRFGSLAQGMTVQLRFPFSTEQDVANITVRVEVTYSTKNGDFCFSTAPSIPVSLALGVNVQDVFKHDAIFSRFSVSTASPSPIVLFKSELRESDVFESEFGFTSGDAHVVFPKQPAGLLYKIKRKRDVTAGTETQKTMYLKLRYTVVLDEIINAVEASLKQAATDSNLGRFTTVLSTFVREEISTRLSGYDLERASLLGEVSTALLVGPQVDRVFTGLGKHPDNSLDISQTLVELIKGWQKDHPTINLDFSGEAEDKPSILIPVDVPSVPIVFTADIQIHTPLGSQTLSTGSGGSVAGVNQLLSASLKLRWTRVWDTTSQADESHVQEFNYDVNAPSDNWLLGGRKRGQIVVSSSESSMEISLMMIPLREGYLPYPTIDIREARVDEERQSYAPGHCETDLRNLGETVRVVANREKVTLSLDSSGPGGGPLVLETETRRLEAPAVA